MTDDQRIALLKIALEWIGSDRRWDECDTTEAFHALLVKLLKQA